MPACCCSVLWHIVKMELGKAQPDFLSSLINNPIHSMWLQKLRRESDVGVHAQQKHTTWTEQPTHKYYVFPEPKGTKYRHGQRQHHSVISITGGINRFGNNTQSPHTQAASSNQQVSIRHQTNVLHVTPNQWLASDSRQMSYAWLELKCPQALLTVLEQMKTTATVATVNLASSLFVQCQNVLHKQMCKRTDLHVDNCSRRSGLWLVNKAWHKAFGHIEYNKGSVDGDIGLIIISLSRVSLTSSVT